MTSPLILQNHIHEPFIRKRVNEGIQRNEIFNNDYLLNTGNDESFVYQQVSERKAAADAAGLVPEKKSEQSSASKGISRAVLAQKYLVYFEGENGNGGESQQEPGKKSISSTGNNTPPKLGPTKVPLRCVNLATKELMQCKISLKDDRGVGILAAHERLGECSEFVNPISELIVTPKHFCFISPATYGNLHSYIYSKTSLKECEAKQLFKQMVSIVNFCHSRGLILRDLKMGKFVFTNKERTIIKLDSLEDAVMLPDADSEDDKLDDRHGCPNYVSPEKTECVMRSGTKYSGKTSDVWALGVSLYAMLAGRYPFNDTDCSRLLHKIRNGSYGMIEGISPFAKSLVRCLLVKNPMDRPSCKEVLTHPWFRTFDFQSAAPVRSRDRDESDHDFKAKRARVNDDQVVPGS